MSLVNLANRVGDVLRRHGVKYSDEEVARLAGALGALGFRNAVEVLDCVLDPECLRYGPESRVPIKNAFIDVFGYEALVKAQLWTLLDRYGLAGLLNLDEVYRAYQEVVYWFRHAMPGRVVYGKTLAKAAIALVIIKHSAEFGLGGRAVRELVDLLGWGRAVKLLEELRLLDGSKGF